MDPHPSRPGSPEAPAGKAVEADMNLVEWSHAYLAHAGGPESRKKIADLNVTTNKIAHAIRVLHARPKPSRRGFLTQVVGLPP